MLSKIKLKLQKFDEFLSLSMFVYVFSSLQQILNQIFKKIIILNCPLTVQQPTIKMCPYLPICVSIFFKTVQANIITLSVKKDR